MEVEITKNKGENKTARFYDFFYDSDKGSEKTDFEVGLVDSALKEAFGDFREKKISILDVGAGSGRISIGLTKLGYDVFSLEPLSSMRRLFLKKVSHFKEKPKIFPCSFENFRTKRKFSAIVLFWNTFSQICYKKKKATYFFKKASKILKRGGVLIIEQDKVGKDFLLSRISYSEQKVVGGRTFLAEYKVLDYNPKLKKTYELEKISIFSGEKKKIEVFSSKIVHRWYDKNEILKIASKFGFELFWEENFLLGDFESKYFVFRLLF